MLKLSRYVTRNRRVVVMKSSEDRQVPDGLGGTKTITIFKGDLLKADGQSIDSEHEWIDTLRQGVEGEHVNHNSNYQIASEYDLVQHVG
jgi:hypothetical protein